MKGSTRAFAKTQPACRGSQRTMHWTTVNNYVKQGKEAFEKRFPHAKLHFKRIKEAVIEWE